MPNHNHKNENPGSPALIMLLTVALLIGASFVPWEKITAGRVKGFSLWSDLVDAGTDSNEEQFNDAAPIDPKLAELMAEETTPAERSSTETTDTIVVDTLRAIEEPRPLYVVRRDTTTGIVSIEDYSADSNGLERLRLALTYRGHGRIAVVGDSYIEGDIFTQDLRSKLQSDLGGSGVGYMGLHSDFPGFRRSVRQSGSGWRVHEIGKKGSVTDYEPLAEHYYTPEAEATATYKATDKVANASSWNVSRLLLIAPNGGTVSVTTDLGTKEFHLDAVRDSVQSIDVIGATARATFKTSEPSIVALGAWLESSGGIGVDCMSSRGFSGLTLEEINPLLSQQMSKYIDYQLIVLEFGINAMSPGQKNFNVYRRAIVRVVEHLRQCYPGADFLIMGIGDRGEKRGGEVRSMASVAYMIDAQRHAAAEAGCMFWDTREAMGGEDAIVEWTRQGLTNKDYIHMTHKGGERLATEFYNALMEKLR
ncbi:MAG: GDSL-type esterase/lipase family protein [Roseburia sp.]|nr:GDSL-type esterase/lipase family protein [Roseburia sp.]